jgi:hypothetical protein
MAVNAEQNQNYNQQQQNTNSTGGGPAQTPGAMNPGLAASQSRTANYSTGQQPGQTGSGRFTNLQKYIGANEGAGDRMAQGIGANLDQKNQATSKEADTSASAVREGIQSANQKLDTGNQYLNQVKDTNFNANDIAGDQNKLQDFTNYRTGNAVDANALAQQNNQAQTNALNYQNQLNQQMQQTQTDQGRYGLLKDAFGGGTVYQNPYSTGQQRLDQLFLQSGGTNGINNIQNNIRGNLGQVGNQLNDLSGNVANTISGIGTQAKDLATNLDTTSKGLATGFISNLESQIPQFNQMRADQQAWATDQYKKLQSGQPIDQKFADLMGLSQGQRTFDILNGTSAGAFLNLSPATAATASDIASQDDVNRYAALAKLAGIDGSQLTTPGNIAPAVSLNGTELADRLAAAANNSADKNFSATWGGGAIVPATSSINLANAQKELSGLSPTGASKLNSLSAKDINNLISGGVIYDTSTLVKAGFSPQDAQILFNAMNHMTTDSSSPAGRDVNLSRLNALAQASGFLGGAVNIAPPSDLEKKQNIT